MGRVQGRAVIILCSSVGVGGIVSDRVWVEKRSAQTTYAVEIYYRVFFSSTG